MKFIQKTDPMEYLEGQEQINSDIMQKVLTAANDVEFDKFSATDVERALSKDNLSLNDLQALLSPVATNYLEEMVAKAKATKERYFGKNIYVFLQSYHWTKNTVNRHGSHCYGQLHRLHCHYDCTNFHDCISFCKY